MWCQIAAAKAIAKTTKHIKLDYSDQKVISRMAKVKQEDAEFKLKLFKALHSKGE